jgi:hypothetical protein
LWDRGLNSKKPWKVLKLACAFLNSLISKRLFSAILNEKDYGYDIYEPINLLILKGESHGSQLQGQKNRTFLSHPDQRGIWKSCDKSKKVCTLYRALLKNQHVFANI